MTGQRISLIHESSISQDGMGLEKAGRKWGLRSKTKEDCEQNEAKLSIHDAFDRCAQEVESGKKKKKKK